MNNMLVIMAAVFLLIYDIQFLRNLKQKYFKHKAYIMPFSAGILLFNIFLLGFIYDGLLGEAYYYDIVSANVWYRADAPYVRVQRTVDIEKDGQSSNNKQQLYRYNK